MLLAAMAVIPIVQERWGVMEETHERTAAVQEQLDRIEAALVSWDRG